MSNSEMIESFSTSKMVLRSFFSFSKYSLFSPNITHSIAFGRLQFNNQFGYVILFFLTSRIKVKFQMRLVLLLYPIKLITTCNIKDDQYTRRFIFMVITLGDLIIWLLIAALVGFLGELLARRRTPFGLVGAIIVGFLAIFLVVGVLHWHILGEPYLNGVPIITSILAAAVLVAF